MKEKQSGFSLTELTVSVLVVVFIAWVLVYIIVGGLVQGNFWYNHVDVLSALQTEHPEITKVLASTKHIWEYSEIRVLEGDTQRTYFLDTDILQNHVFHFRQKT